MSLTPDLNKLRAGCEYWADISTFINDDDPTKFSSFLKQWDDAYWGHISLRPGMLKVVYEENFAETAVRAMKWLSDSGMFSTETYSVTTNELYHSIVNYTDIQSPFGVAVVEAGMLPHLLDILTRYHDSYVQSTSPNYETRILSDCLIILHNVSKQPAAARIVREAGGKEILRKNLDNHCEAVRSDKDQVLTMLCLGYIATDEDMKELIDDYGVVERVVDWLEEALENEEHRTALKWSAEELAAGLACLAVHDDNKLKIVSAGVLPVCSKMMSSSKWPEEQKTAADLIWQLAFNADVAEVLRADTQLMERLSALAEGGMKSASGAIWVMVKGKHIFLSYCWADQETVLWINKNLVNDGLKTWIDVEDMRGSTLEAMAEGIDAAEMVLMCYSENYKASANCRTEAEYVFTIKKPFMAVLLQHRYQPDGWLGMMVGARLYYDLSGKEHSLEGKYSELRSKISDEQQIIALRERRPSMAKAEIVPGKIVPFPSGKSQIGNMSEIEEKIHIVESWTREEVKQWLLKNDLCRYVSQLTEFDGSLLHQLAHMYKSTPQFYYETTMKLFDTTELVLLLTFTKHLGQLFPCCREKCFQNS